MVYNNLQMVMIANNEHFSVHPRVSSALSPPNSFLKLWIGFNKSLLGHFVFLHVIDMLYLLILFSMYRNSPSSSSIKYTCFWFLRLKTCLSIIFPYMKWLLSGGLPNSRKNLEKNDFPIWDQFHRCHDSFDV